MAQNAIKNTQKQKLQKPKGSTSGYVWAKFVIALYEAFTISSMKQSKY